MSKHIVIIGGGFAGLMAAIRLSGKARQHSIQISLINASDEYILRPRLHLWAANETRERRKIADILEGTGTHFIQGWVTKLDPDAQEITVEANETSQTIAYDELVYAIGSRTSTDSVKGAKDYAYMLNEYGQRNAEDLRRELLNYQAQDGKVVVVGGGSTGLEMATQIKSRYAHLDVAIVSRNRLGSFKNDARVEAIIQDIIQSQEIAIYDNIAVQEIQSEHVLCSNGETLAYDICVWTGGFVAPPLAREAGLEVNEQNQVLTDPFQRALSYSNIRVVGDCAAPVEAPGNAYRMSFPVALITGAHAADNLARKLKGQKEEALSFAYYGQGIQLGDNDGVGWMGFPDDRPHKIILTRGRLALTIRRTFVNYLDFVFDIEKRFPGAFVWFGKNRYRNQKKQAQQNRLKGQSVQG